MHAIVCRDLLGDPTVSYAVEEIPVSFSTSDRQVHHHILVIDRSGSMYCDMETIRSFVEKSLVLEEFFHSRLLVSVISYASSGDCVVHVRRTAIEQIMEPGSVHVEQIRTMKASGLTCMSQALDVARGLIEKEEPTVMTFHSDGYANDPSPGFERKKILGTMADLRQNSFLAVDTIAYTDRSDFRLLLEMASLGGGMTTLARDGKAVYEAFLSTQRRVAAPMVPPISIQREESDLLLAWSVSGRKVWLAESSDLQIQIKGLRPTDDLEVYRLKRQSSASFSSSSSTPVFNGVGALALALGWLGRGQIRRAKEALIGAGIDLAVRHWKALSRVDLENLYEDLSAALFDGVPIHLCNQYGVMASGPAVLDVMSTLEAFSSDIEVHLPSLLSAGYRHRSVQRVPGTRVEGSIVSPPVHVEPVKGDGWAKVSSVVLSNEVATANLLLVRPGILFLDHPDQIDPNLLSEVQVDADGVVRRVAQIDMSGLSVYRNYTVISDGTVHLSKLLARVSTRKAWQALARLGVVSGEFDHRKNQVTLDMNSMAVVNLTMPLSVVGLAAKAKILVLTKMLESILRAMGRSGSSRFSPAQIEALGALHISPNLNVSVPTTTPYASQEEALRDGILDTEIETKVEVGTEKLLPSDLGSANEFLRRHFEVWQGQDKVDKPVMADLLSGSTPKHKSLSSRSKRTAVDEMFLPLFLSMLGIEDGDAFLQVFSFLDRDLSVLFLELFRSKPTPSRLSDIVDEMNKEVGRAREDVLEQIRPLVFWIGATGVLPEDLETAPVDAEEAKKRGTLVKGRLEEGSFYYVDGALIVASPNKRFYTVRPSLDSDE